MRREPHSSSSSSSKRRDVLVLVACALLLGWLGGRNSVSSNGASYFSGDASLRAAASDDPYGLVAKAGPKAAPFLESMLRSSLSSGGVKCMEMFDLTPAFRSQLVKEAEALNSQEHFYRTRVFGKDVPGAAHKWPTADKNHRTDDKKFLLDRELYPGFAKLCDTIPGLSFLHLLVIGNDEKNKMHAVREHIERAVFHREDGPLGSFYYGARFHITLTGAKAFWMSMDKDIYTVKDGKFFFYCHGCVHLSGNRGSERRMNLVFDVYFTQEAVDFLFVKPPPSDMLTRGGRDEASPHASECPRIGHRMWMNGPRADEIFWKTDEEMRKKEFQHEAMLQGALFDMKQARSFEFYQPKKYTYPWDDKEYKAFWR